jgi:hypothetical protein
MTKLNSLARARIIGPEGDAEDGAAGAGVGEGAAGVDVLLVSSSPCANKKQLADILTNPLDQATFAHLRGELRVIFPF